MPDIFVYEDKSGVMLQVEHNEDELISVRVLDSNYHVCGPNLAFMLDSLFYLVNPEKGEPYLNSIVEEIKSGRLLRAPTRE